MRYLSEEAREDLLDAYRETLRELHEGSLDWEDVLPIRLWPSPADATPCSPHSR